MEKDKDLELKQCEGECTCGEQDALTEEELLELLNGNALKLNTDNLAEVEICKDCFEEGVHEVSSICGKISALVSVGLKPNEALDFILNEMNIDYNLRLQEINNQAQIEISKNQINQAEKTMI